MAPAPPEKEKERAKPQNRGHHLTQQEKLAAAVLYLKRNWEAHELARQMRVSTGAISRVVKESQKSAGDDDSLAGLLACEFLRPTRKAELRVEKRGKKPKVVVEGEEEVGRRRFDQRPLRKLAPAAPVAVQPEAQVAGVVHDVQPKMTPQTIIVHNMPPEVTPQPTTTS